MAHNFKILNSAHIDNYIGTSLERKLCWVPELCEVSINYQTKGG